MINGFIRKNKVSLIAALIGAFLGGAYYYFVGCTRGNCMIVSNPFIIIPYGAVMAYLLAGSFAKKENVKTEMNENP
jgi:Family of unknown function (DUF6132)